MYKPICLILLLLITGIVTFSQAGNEPVVSGKIIKGFRILSVDPATHDTDFTVYRGDYIKFSFPEGHPSLTFAIKDLLYKDTLFADPDKSPFFKMKATGRYSFTLGSGSGTITVVNLFRPNYTEVTAKEAAELLNNLHPFILDVRTPAEYEKVHIAGTHLIPIHQLQARIGELEPQKHEDIFIYCATGNRSTVASRILADRGFKRIYNLRYGVYDWARNGYPYSTGK